MGAPQDPVSSENNPFEVITKCLVFHGDKVLLLRRSKTAPRRALQWDFPGGFIDKGESPDQAMHRELQEEAGIDAVAHIYHTDHRHREGRNILFIFYWAEVDSDDVRISFEHDKSTWVSVDEAIDMMVYDVQIESLRVYKSRSA